MTELVSNQFLSSAWWGLLAAAGLLPERAEVAVTLLLTQ